MDRGLNMTCIFFTKFASPNNDNAKNFAFLNA